MKEIIAYEMSFKESAERKETEENKEMSDYKKAPEHKEDIICVPFREEYWNEYRKIYNECFYEMRKALEIEPFYFYSDYSQMKDKINNTFLCLHNRVIMGAVSCYGNELDDLIVNKLFQRKGLGQKLLLWGMDHIMEQGYNEIILHVAEWNQNAVKLYLKMGFHIKKKEKVR